MTGTEKTLINNQHRYVRQKAMTPFTNNKEKKS